MNKTKQQKLEAAGWKVGSASEFLELSDAENMLVNMKLALARKVKELRLHQNMSQTELAKRIGSSQSRVAKLETADRSVSLELLIRSLANLGASQEQVGKYLATKAIGKTAPATRRQSVKS